MHTIRPFEKVHVNDFDGNILYAPTPFYLEAKQPDGDRLVIEVPAHEFDANPKKFSNKENYKFVNGDMTTTYQHFHDFHPDFRHLGPDRLIRDITYALDNGKLSPSYPSFKDDVLVNGRLFMILTARANGADNLKRWMKLINDKSLTWEQKEQQIENIKKNFGWEKLSNQSALDRYFDINCYIGVNNIELQKYMSMPQWLSSPEKKTRIMGWYIRYITELISTYQQIDEAHRVKLWFSDDHKDNAYKMLEYFTKLHSEQFAPYGYYDYTLYCTSTQKEARDWVASQIDPLMQRYSNISLDAKEQKIILPTQAELQSILKIDVSLR